MPLIKELVIRNYPIISNDLQAQIARTKVAFLGCGLGSNIALLCARTGFQKFKIADGDIVESSNLNRQLFFSSDIGKNKAEVLSRHIKQINNKSQVQVVSKFITGTKEISRFISDSQAVINTCDFNAGFYDVVDLGSKINKLVICPFNVGFGSAVVVFTAKNRRVVKKLLQKHTHKDDFHNFQNLLAATSKNYRLPKTFKKVFGAMSEIHKPIGYVPQLGIASGISASIVTSILIKHVNKSKLDLFPKVYFIHND